MRPAGSSRSRVGGILPALADDLGVAAHDLRQPRRDEEEAVGGIGLPEEAHRLSRQFPRHAPGHDGAHRRRLGLREAVASDRGDRRRSWPARAAASPVPGRSPAWALRGRARARGSRAPEPAAARRRGLAELPLRRRALAERARRAAPPRAADCARPTLPRRESAEPARGLQRPTSPRAAAHVASEALPIRGAEPPPECKGEACGPPPRSMQSAHPGRWRAPLRCRQPRWRRPRRRRMRSRRRRRRRRRVRPATARSPAASSAMTRTPFSSSARIRRQRAGERHGARRFDEVQARQRPLLGHGAHEAVDLAAERMGRGPRLLPQLGEPRAAETGRARRVRPQNPAAVARENPCRIGGKQKRSHLRQGAERQDGIPPGGHGPVGILANRILVNRRLWQS